jgi:hypothetical protein
MEDLTTAASARPWHDLEQYVGAVQESVLAPPDRIPGMAHDELFDRDDPVLKRIRRIALSFPGAAEKISHGRPAFYTKKVFAYYGGSVRRGEGDWVQHPQSVMVLLDSDERAALLDDPRTFVPAYLGPSGWLGIDLNLPKDLTEVTELIDSSFRNTAPARLINELDTGPS